MTASDATELYLADVNAHPVPDPELQLAWARELDRQQRRCNWAIAADRAMIALLLNCDACRPRPGRAGFIVARCVAAKWTSDDALESIDVLLDDAMMRLRALTNAATHDRKSCYVALHPFRLRAEFVQMLIAAAAKTEAENSRCFMQTARDAVETIGHLTARLVCANQRLVAMLARQYRHGPLPFMDLVQEGNLGLLRAIERFDPAQGTRLSTYALWWIRRAMIYAVARQGRDVRPSLAKYWEARQVARALERLEHQHGRHVTHRQAAHLLAVSVESLHKSFAVMLPHLALDAPLDTAEGTRHIDALVDVSRPNPEMVRMGEDLRHAVAELLKQLPERHAKILRMRFGIGVRDDCTLEQIAQQQGVTRERIRQLEAQALRALRDLDATWRLQGSLG